MTIYLVIYDLNKPGQDYPRIHAYLNSLDSIHTQRSSFYVRANVSATALQQQIRDAVDWNDSLDVVAIDTANMATSDPNVSLWLSSRTGVLAGLFADLAQPSSPDDAFGRLMRDTRQARSDLASIYGYKAR